MRNSVRNFALIVLAMLATGGSVQAEDHVFVSPKATYRIVQEDIKDGEYSLFTTKLYFAKGKPVDLTLGERWNWAAEFYISPNEEWILQIQKTGSGDNTSFLYRLETNHRVCCMVESLYDLAFTYLEQASDLPGASLFHTGVEFDSWDMKAGLLRFSVHGTKDGGGYFERKLAYKLKDHTIVKP